MDNIQYKEMGKDEFQDIHLSRLNRIRIPKADQLISDKIITDPIAIEQVLIQTGNDSLSNLTIANCIFKELLIIGAYNSSGHIYFQNCFFEKDVTIYAGNAHFDDQSIMDGHLYINGKQDIDFILSGIKVSEYIHVQSRLAQRQELNRITSKGIVFNSIALPKTDILHCLFHTIQFKQLDIKGTINIENTKASVLYIVNNNSAPFFHISSSTINEIEIVRGTDQGGHFQLRAQSVVQFMKLGLGDFKEVNISDSQIGDFEIYGHNGKEDILTVEKFKIISLSFRDIFNNGQISFREVSMDTQSVLSLISSTLGKMDFIRCNLLPGILEFENSKMTEVFLAESDFTRTIFLNGQKNHDQAQLIFGQLNTAYAKQGDTVRALEYQSRELEAHYNPLKWLKKKCPFISSLKFNLWLKKRSNRFGRSWVRGIAFTFISGMIFFLALLISTEQYHFGTPSWNFELLPAFLKFMNPIRFFELDKLFDGSGKKICVQSWSFFGISSVE